MCQPCLFHRISWHKILNIIGWFCTIVFCVSFWKLTMSRKLSSHPHGLGTLAEGPCLRLTAFSLEEECREEGNNLCTAFLSLVVPVDLSPTIPKAENSCTVWKDKIPLPQRPLPGAHYTVPPRRLTFRGNTSLFIEKKEAMALVQEHRPATFPHTRLAVSML